MDIAKPAEHCNRQSAAAPDAAGVIRPGATFMFRGRIDLSQIPFVSAKNSLRNDGLCTLYIYTTDIGLGRNPAWPCSATPAATRALSDAVNKRITSPARACSGRGDRQVTQALHGDTGFTQGANTVTDASAARQQMISGQIRPNKVTDQRVIDAFAAIPRESFLPRALKGVAYLDEDLQIKPGRFLMEPMVMARLVQAAGVLDSDVVLDVGCATGYSSAILGSLAATVVALEEDAELAKEAGENLSEAEIDNVAVVQGALSEGAPKHGPYQVIFLNGAAGEIPAALTEQLDEGGRLVFVRLENNVGHGHIITKTGGLTSGRDLFDAGTPLLPGFGKKAAFEF